MYTAYHSPLSLLHVIFFLVELELLMDRVNDLVEMRIDAVLHEMSGSTLCVLPEEEPITCEEFVRTTRVKNLRIFKWQLSTLIVLFIKFDHW